MTTNTQIQTKPFRFANDTIRVLKNFSGINTGIVFRAGSTITTLNNEKCWLARLVVPETESIPEGFGIWDLNCFLASLGLFTDPRMEVLDKSIRISEGNTENSHDASFQYFKTDPSIITHPAEKIGFADDYFEFSITEIELDKLIRSAAIVKADKLSFRVDENGNIIASTLNSKNPTGDVYQMTIKASLPKKATFNIKLDLLKLRILHQNYRIRVSKSIVEFHHENDHHQLTYWVGVSPDSEWTTDA